MAKRKQPKQPSVTVYVEMPIRVLNALIRHQRRTGQSTAMGVAVRAAAIERARQIEADRVER